MSIFIAEFDIKGLNISRFIRELKSSDIAIFDLKRFSYDHIEIGVNANDVSNFYKVANRYNFKITKTKMNFKDLLVSFVKKNSIFFLTIVLSLVSILVFYNFIFKFEIIGDLDVASREKIEEVLKANDIVVGKPKSRYDLGKIESILLNKVNTLSLVSLTIYGNAMIINGKQKIDNSSILYNFEPIVAEFDMIIEKANLISGTMLVDEGQIVKKGDILVEPYVFVGDKKLSVEAKANFKAYVEVVETSSYFENHTTYQRNGNVLSTSYLNILGLDLFKNKTLKCLSSDSRVLQNEDNNVPFRDFDVEIIESYVCKNLILPIKKTKVFIFELKEINTFEPFSENIRQNLIEKNKKILYNQLGGKYTLDSNNIEFDSTLIQEENCFLISTYLKTVVSF